MIHLYEGGKFVGAIQQFEFQQGHNEVSDVPMFGGMHYVHCRREPDLVTFQLPFSNGSVLFMRWYNGKNP